MHGTSCRSYYCFGIWFIYRCHSIQYMDISFKGNQALFNFRQLYNFTDPLKRVNLGVVFWSEMFHTVLMPELIVTVFVPSVHRWKTDGTVWKCMAAVRDSVSDESWSGTGSLGADEFQRLLASEHQTTLWGLLWLIWEVWIIGLYGPVWDKSPGMKTICVSPASHNISLQCLCHRGIF